MENKKILVFASKSIGLNCIDFLLKEFPNDTYDIVIMDPEAEKIKDSLSARDIKFYDVDTYKTKIRTLGLRYDWLLNLWGGLIFKENDLQVAKSSLNIHPSYLPFGRGRDPVVWGIKYAHPLGATIHSISLGIDEGDIYAQKEVPYNFGEPGSQVYEKVILTCEELFKNVWPDIRAEKIAKQPQDLSPRTNLRSDLIRDRLIDLDENKELLEVFRTLLAHDFSPGYSAQVKYLNKIYNARLIIEAVNKE